MEMVTLPLWLVDMEHFQGLLPSLSGLGLGEANMGCPGPWAPPTSSGLCVGPPPAAVSPTPVWHPQPLHPSSIVGLFQTCPLYMEPLAQRVASPFS